MLGVAITGALGPAQGVDSQSGAAAPEDPYRAERDAWATLAAVDRLGPIALAALLARFETGRAILETAARPGGTEALAATPPVERVQREVRRPVAAALAEAIAAAAATGPAIPDRVRSLGLTVVTVEEPTYPARLLQIAMPPHVLFVEGNVSALNPAHAVAVVGTRRPSTAGRTTAGRIATALVAAGATVVSGLAYGIDGVAHETTIRTGGTTVAVLGGGHATAVPTGHQRLARAIVDEGGAVISELAPDVVPTRGTFPRRNRIISGLADATVVVEAPASSGALVTASWALEQGRECFLVPGGLHEPASAGCLAFLREFHDQARIVAGVPQLIADLGLGAPVAGVVDGVAGAALLGLGATAERVAATLGSGPKTVDELVATLDLPVATVLATLAVLDGRGLVAGSYGRYRPTGALLGDAVTGPPR